MLKDCDYKIIGAIKNGKDKRAIVIFGIAWGYANPQYKRLPIIKETEHYFLCRVRGGTDWVSLGATSYFHPRYIIFTKNPDDKTIKNPMGDWELDYSKKDMYEKKQIALNKIEEMERKTR